MNDDHNKQARDNDDTAELTTAELKQVTGGAIEMPELSIQGNPTPPEPKITIEKPIFIKH